ncbi:hypothetical protein NIES4071_51580 [Calothrix sp. NIES-4071]|nr:hypothetical protein NIES4071_51580 [Calothrix sp. NIES-4071]BAZ59466.1 hypothetical protein NIES4105_51530 [Calothrix sp. NIES-4105]
MLLSVEFVNNYSLKKSVSSYSLKKNLEVFFYYGIVVVEDITFKLILRVQRMLLPGRDHQR